MRKILLPFLVFLLLVIGGCQNSTSKSTEKEEQEQLVKTCDVARFKLFPTQNIWTFLKLDTQTGQIWQVQFSIGDDDKRFECVLNPNPLIADVKKVNGRFELYPTQNIYNFILLDKVNGKSWQVQWSFDAGNRGILPVSE